MEKDIGKISKGPDTDIIVRIDDFGGKVGLTIREFVHSERYTGFTKAGTRIPADKFKDFKALINVIDDSEFVAGSGDSSSGKEEKVKKRSKKETENVMDQEKKGDKEVEERGDSGEDIGEEEI